jgi:hypothetical protein
MMSFGDTMPDWMKEEPLHDDLVSYIRQVGAIGDMVHHPLVVSAMSMGRNRCSHINGLYAQKKEAVATAVAEHRWSRAIMLHERPYRFDALMAMTDKGLEHGSVEFWEAVGQVWIDSENIHESFKQWLEVWRSNPANRHHVMSETDRAGYSGLPKKVRLYRGFSWRGTKLGLSWTTSRKKAIWFANRFEDRDSGYVITATVAKDNVLAYFNGRNEVECVVDPEVIGKTWEYVDQ